MEPIDKEGKVTVHIGENTVRLQRKKEGGEKGEGEKPFAEFLSLLSSVLKAPASSVESQSKKGAIAIESEGVRGILKKVTGDWGKGKEVSPDDPVQIVTPIPETLEVMREFISLLVHYTLKNVAEKGGMRGKESAVSLPIALAVAPPKEKAAKGLARLFHAHSHTHTSAVDFSPLAISLLEAVRDAATASLTMCSFVFSLFGAQIFDPDFFPLFEADFQSVLFPPPPPHSPALSEYLMTSPHRDEIERFLLPVLALELDSRDVIRLYNEAFAEAEGKRREMEAEKEKEQEKERERDLEREREEREREEKKGERKGKGGKIKIPKPFKKKKEKAKEKGAEVVNEGEGVKENEGENKEVGAGAGAGEGAGKGEGEKISEKKVKKFEITKESAEADLKYRLYSQWTRDTLTVVFQQMSDLEVAIRSEKSVDVRLNDEERLRDIQAYLSKKSKTASKEEGKEEKKS